jgi:hypothetical protein
MNITANEQVAPKVPANKQIGNASFKPNNEPHRTFKNIVP